ncbi:MAG: hypothetical protein O9262_11105 [Cyclobacteriaceae bacterium]|nr:hypothetical protein [Cyclobacteriaceae bacterium]
MDYISILGKKVNEALTNSSEYSIKYNDLGADENIEPTWIVKAKDGRYEMILSIDKMIRTIFIFPIQDKLDGFDFEASKGRSFIIERMGTPSKSGQEMLLPILGTKGGFDRYDYNDYSIHFEYTLGQQRIEKITLMLPEVIRDL